jgi:hypothetical protein
VPTPAFVAASDPADALAAASDEELEKLFDQKVRRTVRLKVWMVCKLWIEEGNDFDSASALVDKYRAFVEGPMLAVPEMKGPATQLLASVKRKIEGVASSCVLCVCVCACAVSARVLTLCRPQEEPRD